MNEETLSLLRQIEKSPSCYHVIGNMRERLLSDGYTELHESEAWTLMRGGRYFVVRNDSSVIAFRIPAQECGGFMIAAAHSDSPTFKLKENAEKKGAHYVQLHTEKYGGMLMATWFDRPLSVAGRILVREGDKIASRLVSIERDLLLIPSVAIHMNRSANDGVKLQANIDTLPLYGMGECESIRSMIARENGISESDILGSDLYLCCRNQGTVFGAHGEFIASPKLDDLMCAFGCLEGFLRAESKKSIPVLAVFDNEEVGSETKQGAASSFLRDTLRRINLVLGGGEEDYLRRLAVSFMVSADNAQAQHPNHPEYSDADNCPYMNGGIVIKFNAAQNYATDGRSGAVFRAICANAGVKTQVMSNRSDLAGGSTLGSISNTMVPVSTVDIGLAQLAMHSAYETAGAEDYSALIAAMTEYFASSV